MLRFNAISRLKRRRARKTPAELAAEWRAATTAFSKKFQTQIERFKFDPDQINTVQEGFRRLTTQFDLPGPEMARIERFTITYDGLSVPMSLFVPFGADEPSGPCMIYLHGGGFVTSDVDTHAGITRRLANGSACRVLSVDYRLAPQHPYPAAPSDCEAALRWALSGAGLDEYGIDPAHLSIGGDSAGGNMAAYLAQKYRDKLSSQILFYPLMQLIELKPARPGPQDWMQIGFVALKFIDEHYIAGADTQDTRLSPLLEPNLKGLPPAYILTAGLDPLREEGKAYADKLRAHGCRVKYHHEKTMPHGFLNFARFFPKAKSIPLDAADIVRAHFPKPQQLRD